jgi:Family of unknown function (DUF6459)
MTTSAPQWPGQEGSHEQPEEERDRPARPVVRWAPVAATNPEAPLAPDTTTNLEAPLAPDTTTNPEAGSAPDGTALPVVRAVPDGPGQPVVPAAPDAVGNPPVRPVPNGVARRLQAVPGSSVVPEPGRRPAGRRRLVVVRDLAERELRAARRRARANLPPPAAVTRDIALALLEVEAGCRSAAQLERIFSRELWEDLERRIGRRGGPLPSGRSLLAVQCQEDTPGLADTVAVVRKGDLVRPVALRLDAGGGRWIVTELRWWRNETDTATTSGRDGGSS